MEVSVPSYSWEAWHLSLVMAKRFGICEGLCLKQYSQKGGLYRFGSLLCLKGLSLNLLPGWVCPYWWGVGGDTLQHHYCGSSTDAGKNGGEVAWSVGPEWKLAPCCSSELWGGRCYRLIVPHWWWSNTPKGSQWMPHSSVLALIDPFELAGGPSAVFRASVLPPAVLWVPQCFLLLVVAPVRAGKVIQLPWSLS